MAMNDKNYYTERDKSNMLRIRELQRELPNWFGDYLRAAENGTSTLTRLNYCFDMRVFLNYLIAEHPGFYGLRIKNISCNLLNTLSLKDLEKYVEYLGYFIDRQEREHENAERGKARKIASLRSIFKYLYKHEQIQGNPAALLEMPKNHTKAITTLSSAEINTLLDVIASGEGLTGRARTQQQAAARRDMAIVVLFLTTGIRVSELVGLDIRDVDFDTMSFKVIRKGGSESILYFDYETANALEEYLDERRARETYALEAPLFLNNRGERLGVRSVENIVKKYARLAAPLKRISPHKLRSTYGTMLYRETGDIYLVADVLGHKDINTTKRHYADMSDENRRLAAKKIRLRPEE